MARNDDCFRHRDFPDDPIIREIGGKVVVLEPAPDRDNYCSGCIFDGDVRCWHTPNYCRDLKGRWKEYHA